MPKKINLVGGNTGIQVPVSELTRQINRYRDERHKHIIQHITTDSRAVWLDRQILENFFSNNSSASGVRIYFGVIEDTKVDETDQEPWHYQGAHNLIFVPTQKTGDQNEDQLSDDDWVIVVENIPFNKIVDGQSKAAICPPPTKPCGGNRIPY